MIQRNEELIKDLESLRLQQNEIVSQRDRARLELTDVQGVKAAQTEQLQQKEAEIKELKSAKMELEREQRDRDSLLEKNELQLHQYQLQVSALQSDKTELTDRFTAVESARRLSQDQAQQLKFQLEEMSQAKAELSGQINEIMDQRQDLRQENVNLEQRESHMKQQIEDLKIQMKENRENYFSTIESMKTELQETRERQVYNSNMFTKHLNDVTAEHNASLHSVKLELAEERSEFKRAKQEMDQQRTEFDQLQQNAMRLEDENSRLKAKLEKCLQDLQSKEMSAADGKRSRELEQQLYEAFSKMKKIEKTEIDYLRSISSNIDTVLNTLKLQASSDQDSFKTEATATIVQQFDDPNLWVAEIKNKLRWLQCEVQLLNSQQRRGPLQSSPQNTAIDRSLTFPESVKSTETCTTPKPGINFECKKSGPNLQENPPPECASASEVKPQQSSSSPVPMEHRQHVIDEMEDYREIERGKIEKRYLKLQETMRSLQQELELPTTTKERQPN
ncbi:hypothetical protein Ahia01_000405400 [Argonauta hians]